MPKASKVADGDLVIRVQTQGDQPILVLRVEPGPDQCFLRSREEATSQARRYAQRLRTRVWIDEGDDRLRLLDDFSDAVPVRASGSIAQITDRLRGEFIEMPGLRLTRGQVQLLCGLEATLCQAVLDALVDARFLRRNGDSTYAKLGDGVSVQR